MIYVLFVLLLGCGTYDETPPPSEQQTTETTTTTPPPQAKEEHNGAIEYSRESYTIEAWNIKCGEARSKGQYVKECEE